MDNLNKSNNKLSRHEMELKNTLAGVKAYVQIRDKERVYVEKTVTGARGRIGVEEVAEIKKSKTPENMKNKRYNAAVKLQYNRKTKEWNAKVLGRKEVLEKQLKLLKELEASDLDLEETREDIREVRELIEKELEIRRERAEARRNKKAVEEKEVPDDKSGEEKDVPDEKSAEEKENPEEKATEEDPEQKAAAEREAAIEAEKKEKIPDMPTLDDVPEKPLKEFINQENIIDDYTLYKDLMIQSYYGNEKYAKMYDESIRRLTSKDNLIEKTSIYKDPKTGKEKEIKYQALKMYDGYDMDTRITQLQEYAARLERFNAYNAGDLSVYDSTDNPMKIYEEDKEYLETYNNKYNSRKTTYESLKTLGNYGKKVPYSNWKEDDTNLKKVLLGTGNVLKFIRNHTTAPINKFIGTKIVAPLYKRNAIKNDKWEYPNPFENRPTHRYEKRKEYFRAKGDNAITSRIDAIFKYKEGNECTLAARGKELMYDANRKGLAEARLNRRIEELGAYKVLLSDYAKGLTDKMNACITDEKKAEYRAAIENARKQAEIADRETKHILGLPEEDMIDFDAIDKATRVRRNEKDVTRIITGVKMFARAGIKFTSDKLRDWLETNTQTTVMEEVPVERGGYYEQREIEVLKYDGTDKSMDSFLGAKNGQTVQVYGSTYPGADSVPYTISDATTIRGIKADINGVDYSISDLGGVYSKGRVNNVADGFVEALKQTTDGAELNLSAEEIGKMITEGNQGDIYIAVSDSSVGIPRGWLKIPKEELQQHFGSTLVSEKQMVQGDWIEKYTEMVQQEKIVYNKRAIDALNVLNKTRPIANTIGVAHAADIAYENARDVIEDDRNYLKAFDERIENPRERKMTKFMREKRGRRSQTFEDTYYYEENDKDLGGRVDKKGFNYNPRTGKFEGSVIKKSDDGFEK